MTDTPAEDPDLPFRARGARPVVWYRQSLSQSNHSCLYCGRYLAAPQSLPSNKEHLIGRNFVPEGYLDRDAFNFIFRACLECNAEKSAAEGHVSSVTLLTSPGRATDSAVDQLAARKASRDFHPIERGKLVRDAHYEHTVVMPAFFGTATFKFVGPPQLAEVSVNLLACRQVQALFSLVTSGDPRLAQGLRLLPPNNVLIFGSFSHRDWGHPHVAEITRRTASWESPLLLHTARGYFKALFRCSPDDGTWFWALEWNSSHRVLGAIGDPNAPPNWLVADLPRLQTWGAGGHRFRRETPLGDSPDTLFAFPDAPPHRP